MSCIVFIFRQDLYSERLLVRVCTCVCVYACARTSCGIVHSHFAFGSLFHARLLLGPFPPISVHLIL
jgi:hypothetical protein